MYTDIAGCYIMPVESSEDLWVGRQFKTIFFSTIIKVNGSFKIAAKKNCL